MAVEMTPLLQILDWSGSALGLIGAYTLAFRLRISRYGWLAFFAANLVYIALAGRLGVMGLLAQQVGFMGSSAIGIYRNFLDRAEMRRAAAQEAAWSISVRLAAIPPSHLIGTPADLIRLIEQAKTLHPEMAAGARDRELRGEASAMVG